MKATGEPADSEAIRKAMIFVSRCQNLPSEHNGMDFAKKAAPGDEGGMIYSPANGGETKVVTERLPDESVDGAGEEPQGGLRSYASMTYAGLKSFLYAAFQRTTNESERRCLGLVVITILSPIQVWASRVCITTITFLEKPCRR